MSNRTSTIRQYLLSHFKDSNGNPNGYGVDNTTLLGDYYHPNTIINQTYSKIFEPMELTITPSPVLQKDFCKYFYNREIGYEVFAQFLTGIESELNTSCFNLLKMYDSIRNMLPDEMLKTFDTNSNTDQTAEQNQKSNQAQISLTENTPEKDLKILYPNSDGIISHADVLGESHANASSNADTEANSKTHSEGYNTRSRFEMFNMYAQMTDLETQIFHLLDKHFLQLF